MKQNSISNSSVSGKTILQVRSREKRRYVGVAGDEFTTAVAYSRNFNFCNIKIHSTHSSQNNHLKICQSMISSLKTIL